MPKYIIIAGANGVGKSTLYHTLNEIKDMPKINVDDIVRSIGSWQNTRDQIVASKEAVRRLQFFISSHITFNQETTLCGHTVLHNIMSAKKAGFEVESFENLKKVLPICDTAYFYDNTYAFRRFAIYSNGKFVSLSENLPKWFTNINLT